MIRFHEKFVEVDEPHCYAIGWGGVLVQNNDEPEVGPNAPQSATAAAKAEANAVRDEGLRGVASALETGKGTYTGRSTGAGGGPLHPVVEAAYAQVPEGLRPPFHGDCAEGRAISRALADGADVAGGKMAVKGAGGDDHGRPMIPCPSCQWIMDAFGIKKAK